MNRRRLLQYLLLLTILFSQGFFTGLLASDTYTWTGAGGDGQWTTSANWENDGPNGVPDLPPYDADVIINGNHVVILSIPTNYTVESVHLKNGAMLTIAFGATLTTRKGNVGNEGFTIESNAVLVLEGALNIYDLDANLDIGLFIDDLGSASIGVNGVLYIPDYGGTHDRTCAMRVDGSLTNNGTVLITNPSDRGILMGSGGSVTNNSSGAITVSGGFEGIYFRSSSSITNEGTITLSGASSKIIEGGSGWSLTNNGTLAGTGTIKSKYLSFGDGSSLSPGNSAGTLIFDNGSNAVNLNGVTLIMEVNGPTAVSGYDQIQITGSGDLKLAGSTLQLTGSYTPVQGDQFFLAISTGTGSVTGTFGGGPFQINNVSLTDLSNGGLEFGQFLPVEFTSFTARQAGKAVQLHWSTATEINNDYFAVEHSTDGRHFTVIGKVSGFGTTQEAQYYNFVHDTPGNGLNYYRLNQYDFDGAHEYSKIQTILFEGEDLWTIRPTLARQFVSVEWLEVPQSAATVEVFNVAGQKVYSQEAAAWASRLEIPVEDWIPGMYWVLVRDAGQGSARRFVKE